MPHASFSHVNTWVFDLDNTLYPPSARLFDQIEQRMTHWVMTALNVDEQRADYLRRHYWHTYGTTLAGLMREHDLDPGPYLHEVHEISFDALIPDPLLAARIAALPGRRIIYTNGTRGLRPDICRRRIDPNHRRDVRGRPPQPDRPA